MKYLFDNNLPPAFAKAIHELCQREENTEVFALKQKFSPDTKDIDWINALAAEKNWVVISQDRFKKGNQEKEALRRSGLTVFFLDKQWAKGRQYWDKAQNLVRWWPSIMMQAERMKGGSAFRIPWAHGSVGKFEQVRL